MVAYVKDMDILLSEYPGVAVSQFIIDTTSSSNHREDLKLVVLQLEHEMWTGKKLDRTAQPWLPPDWWLTDWKHHKAANRLRKQDAQDENRQKWDAIHNSVIADASLRLFPAVWTLEYNEVDKEVAVSMLSDYSYKCFRKPITIKVQSKLLADHGSKLQVGLSIISNVLPELVSLDDLQPRVEEMVTKAKTLHNMIQEYGVTHSKMFTSTATQLAPGEAVLLLQDLLRTHDASFHPLMISKMSGLEPAVNKTGHYVWANRDEIESNHGELTPCFGARSDPPAAIAPVTATIKYKLDIEKVTVLNDLRDIFCHWELIDGSSSPSKNHGKTSEPTDDTDPLATGSVAPFDLEGVQSNEQLVKYKLVVQIKKKPSSLSRSMLRCSQRLKSRVSGTVIGVGELDKLKVDVELPIPVMNPKTKAQVATVTCRITSS